MKHWIIGIFMFVSGSPAVASTDISCLSVGLLFGNIMGARQSLGNAFLGLDSMEDDLPLDLYKVAIAVAQAANEYEIEDSEDSKNEVIIKFIMIGQDFCEQ